MTASTVPDLQLVRELLLDDESLVRALASGRQRNQMLPFRRVELRYVDLAGGRKLQITSYGETQAHVRNLELGEPAGHAVDDALSQPFANWHVETTKETLQVRVTKKGKTLVHRSVRPAAEVVEPDRGHDRTKRRRLDESDPMFALLGVTTDTGEIKPTRMAKFRQVQDLLAALDPLVADAVRLGPGHRLSADRPLRLVDLGCGNAYLTFAAFRYLDAVKKLPVRAIGLDLKAQSRAHNSLVARDLGLADRLEFVESTIGGASVEAAPDLVMALHACDTATDEALARAVRWGSPVVVAAPCCHHDISRQLSASAPVAATAPAEYALITRHGILRERFADVLTDALRAAILRLCGYRVDVIEFVDSRHTPRNALIRAVRTTPPGAEPPPVSQGLLDAYHGLLSTWQVEPALATLLSADFPVLRTRDSEPVRLTGSDGSTDGK